MAGLISAVGIPTAVWGERWLAHELIDSSYTAAYQDVSQIRGDLQDTNATPQQPAEQPSLLGRIESWFSDSYAQLKDKSNAIPEGLNARVESALTLMAIFLVEVFVLPSLFGYALYRGLQSMIAAMFSIR